VKLPSFWLLASFVLLACGPQVATDGDEDSADDAADDDSAGEQPAKGAMYSPCSTVEDCVPLAFCVFPTREGGYCAGACERGDDIAACAPSPGEAEVSCLDIGTPDERTACALDCSNAACPNGMSCEAIATPSGDRRDICF
jgi:hypothetical protein